MTKLKVFTLLFRGRFIQGKPHVTFVEEGDSRVSFSRAVSDFTGGAGKGEGSLGFNTLFLDYMAHIGAHEILHTLKYRASILYSNHAGAKNYALSHERGINLASGGVGTEKYFFPSTQDAIKKNQANTIPAEMKMMILYYMLLR